ncbi:MAG: extracellular solute-binding protein [Armatimonadota bacterium]
MKIKKIFLKLTLLLLLCGVLLNLPAQANKIDIHFWYSIPPEYSPLMSRLIEEFNQKKAYYNVIPRNFESQEELFNALMKGDEVPNVALINAGWQSTLVNTGRIEMLEDIMDKVGSTLKVIFKMDTFKSILKTAYYKDKIWSMPFYAVNYAILYNPDILKTYKLKAPPKTWAELLEVGKKIKKNGGYVITIPANSDVRELGRIFASFLMQYGGDLSDSGAEEYAKVMSFYSDLVNKHNICAIEDINTDKVLMFIGDAQDYLDYKRKGVNLKAAPMLKHNKRASYIDAYNLVIFKSDKLDPMKAWNFIYWISEFQRSLIWSLETPYLPAHKQVTLSPGYFQFLQDNPDMRVFLSELKVGNTETDLYNYEVSIKKIGESFKMVIRGSKNPSEGSHSAKSATEK